jgi:predicted GIY-YIG superfamily endonuclease
MAKISDATFTGQSGTQYSFHVYPIDQEFKSVGAVYAVTRRYKNPNAGYSHEIIYVGETSDLSTRFESHHKASCFTRHNANCICTHREDDEDSRLTIEDDLVKQHDPACND